VAERNLNRFTVAVGVLWAAAIVLLGVLERFTSVF
jgi:preprotein translocase subunit SecG